MSGVREAWTWRHAIIESDLPSTTRHVLLTLSCHISDSGRAAAVTVADLVTHTGLSKTAVMLHLKAAEKSGWLAVQKHGLAGVRWNTNEYKIMVPGTRDVPELPPKRSHRSEVQPGTLVNDVDHSLVHDVDQTSRTLVNHVDHHVVNDVDHHISTIYTPPISPPLGGFVRFWSAWPEGHRIARAKCERAWKRQRLDGLADQIIAGLQVWQRSDRWARGFVCNPFTFLNQQRWLPEALPKDVKTAQPTTSRCRCGEPGVVCHDGKIWHCRAHDPERQERAA